MKFYDFKSNGAAFDDLIAETRSFAADYLEKKTPADKDNRIKELNKGIIKYCAADTAVEKFFAEDDLSALKNPMVTNNANFQANFNVVLAEIVNSILPMVVNYDYSKYLAEVRQVGWGETALFKVRSNELYKVNEVAEGVNRGVLQHIYDNEFTVNARKWEIASSVDWYPVAAGVYDFGDFGLRAARSFEADIFVKTMNAVTAGVTSLGDAYSASGFTNANWTTLVQRVSAANGGAAVYAIGTLAALNQIYPSAVGLQYGLGEELVKKGHLDSYLGARLIPIDQVFTNDGAVNTTGTFLLPDDKIIFIAADQYAPVKIVFEGTSSFVERDPDYSTDRTYAVRIHEKYGVSAIVGSKYAMLDL